MLDALISKVLSLDDFTSSFTKQRVLLSSVNHNDNRLHNDAIRTTRFLILFSTFAISFGGFSYYVYQRPNDGPSGNSCVSRTRRIPFLGWFFRQPKNLPANDNSDGIIANHNNETIQIALEERQGLLSTDKDPNVTHNNDHVNNPKKVKEKKDINVNDNSSLYLLNSPTLVLILCALGLLVTYITWGFMQERIMSHPYGDRNDENNWFKHSEFCVLINRVFGVIVSLIALLFVEPSGNDSAPFIVSMCSLSNMCSSWFQYESLHYVSFPVQTIFKSSKVLITMSVGVLMGKSYTVKQYVNACLVAVGVYIFLSQQRKNNSEERDVGGYFYLGLVLVIGYAFTDAFTSNWQAKIFEQSKISSIEMMLSVNAFTFVISVIFCFGSLNDVYMFYAQHPLIIWHSLIMGLCGGFGQLLIFYTIAHFGAVKFASVMTTRMVLGVLLSIIYYGHKMTILAGIGMTITFVALFQQAFDSKSSDKNKKSEK